MATALRIDSQIQQLNASDVRLLWFVDFWDGPINGLCMYNNKEHWFELIDNGDDDSSDTTSRHYFVVELLPEQIKDELRWQELFRQKVGTHCDFAEPNPEVKPQEAHREFYDAYAQRRKPDYSVNPIVGWFAMD